MRGGIVNWGTDSKSCWWTLQNLISDLVNTCPKLLLCAEKEDAKGPLGAQEPSLKFYFIELALGSP